MDPRSALLVAVLIVLAGCSAVSLGEDGTPTETVTPVAVESPETDAAPVSVEELPPGVAPNGTVDSERLRAAHHEALGNRSYTWSVVGSTAPSKDATQRIDRTVIVEGEQLLLSENRSTRRGDISLYVEGSEGYLRSHSDEETWYSSVPFPESNRTYAFGPSLIEEFLADVTVDTEAVERDGRRYYRLRSDTGRPERLTRNGRTVRNYSATAYVRSSGFVPTMVVEYEERAGDDWNWFRYRFDYTLVGNSTVAEPEWVETARAQQQSDESSTEAPASNWAGTATPTPEPTSAPTGSETASTSVGSETASTPAKSVTTPTPPTDGPAFSPTTDG